MTCENPIILGGAGSSGSTLLINIISRHPNVVSGPELSLLNKSLFFQYTQNITPAKARKIARQKISSDGWVLYPRIFFDRYGFSQESIYKFLIESKSTRDFLDRFYGEYMKHEKATLWAEKTPSNAYCFDEIKAVYPKARFIHIYRDGRDVVTSLIKRNWSPYNASMTWIYNTSMALKYHGNPNYYGLKYESLVANPEKEIKKICDFLQIEFSDTMLKTENQDSKSIDSWNHKPTGTISSSSVGQYKDYFSEYISYIFYHSAISKSHINKHNLSYYKASQLLNLLGYDIDMDDVNQFEKKDARLEKELNKLIRKDFLTRTKKLLITNKLFHPYPGAKI